METYTRREAQEKYAAGIEEQRVLNYNRAIYLYSEAIELNKEVPEYYAQRGLARFEQSDSNLALQDAQQCILIDESYREGHILIIKCYIALGEVAHATEALESLSEICGSTLTQPLPEETQLKDLRFLLADYKKDFELKEYDSCLGIMTKAIRISPGALNFQLRRSECMLRKKHFTEAENIAQKVVSLGCFNSEAHYTLGLIYYHRDMPEIAMQSLECCLRNDQEYGKAKTLRALIKHIIAEKGRANNFFKAGKYQDALSVYQNILALEITDNDEVLSKMWYNCALMLSKLNNTEDAIQYCSEALIINPRYYKAFLMRAQCHFKLLNYDECVRDCISVYDIEKTADVRDLFDKSLEHSSRSLLYDNGTEKLIASGLELLDGGRYTEAIVCISNAIKICPMNIKYYEYRIECAMKSENLDSALKDLDLLTLISNKNDARLLTKVRCLLLKGDMEEAKVILGKMHNIDKQKKNHFNELGVQLDRAFDIRKYMEQKQYGECLSLMQELFKASGMKYLGISYKLMRAECLYNLCDYDKSMKILEEIIQSDSSNAKAAYLKGLVFYQMMKFDKAIEQFNECFFYDTKNMEAQSMLKRATKLQSKYCLGLQLYDIKYFEHANMALAEMLKLLDNINDRNIYYFVMYDQAKCLFQWGKYDVCIDKCMQISENMKSINVKPLLEAAQEKWKTTRNTLNEEILISRDADIKINEGRTYYDKQDYRKARASFSEAITIISKYSQSMIMDSKVLKDNLLLASYYMKMGDVSQTESILHRIEELKLADPAINTIIQNYRQLETSVKNAIKFFNESDYHQCLFHIGNALKKAGASEDFKMISAECWVWLGEYHKALQILGSLDSSKDDGYIRGMIAYLQNDLDGAMNHLKRCVTKDNGHNSAERLISNSQSFKNRIQKGNELMENEKFEDAIIIFTEAMAVDKKNSATKSELHLKCAECNKKLGCRKECINECNLALKLVPHLVKAKEMRDQCQEELEKIGKEKLVNQNAVKHIQNGDDYKASGNLDKSIESYTKAIDLQPNNVTYFTKRAECYFLIEDFESTLNDVRKATQLDKTFIDGYVWEAKCLIKLGQTESEIKIFQYLENMNIMNTCKFEQKEEILFIQEICSSYKREEYADCINQIDIGFEHFPNSLYYKIKQTKCFIKIFQLNTAAKAIQQLETSNYSRTSYIFLLKGLLYYYNDDYAVAEDNLTVYNNLNRDEEAEELIERCKVLQNVITPVNDREKGLQKFDKEIAKYDSNKWGSDIRMRLFYQRALFKHTLGEKKNAIEDCSLAMKENPKYVNALKLKKKLQRESGRIDDCPKDYELLPEEKEGNRKLNETNGKKDDTASISSAKSVENVCNQNSTTKAININKINKNIQHNSNSYTCNCCLKMNINIKSIGKCLKFW